MIDIIIPAYNAHDTIKRTLLSILQQNNIKNINTYIIDDHSKIGYEKEYNLFKNKMNLFLIRLNKNMGPGYARQYGINKSKSKYILFMDSDDLLYNCESVEKLYNEIERNNLDAVTGDLMEIDGEESVLYTVGFDVLHAKMYRRSFIKQKNISFPNFYHSEDLSFNNLVLMNRAKIGYCDSVIYVYQRRKNSLTMKEEYYQNEHIKYYCENLIWTIKEAEKNGVIKKEIAKIVTFSFAYLYYYFFDNIEDDNIEYMNEIVPIYKKYNKYLNKEEKAEQINFWLERMEIYPGDMTFNEFISLCYKNCKKTNRT